MTEEQWNICADFATLFESSLLWGKVSVRKYRLFAAACCARIWDLLPDERSRQAVEMLERYADGQCTEMVLRSARGMFDDVDESTYLYLSRSQGMAQSAAVTCVIDDDYRLAHTTAIYCSSAVEERGRDLEEQRAQCDLIRDMCYHLFRPVPIDPLWLTSTVLGVAQTIYAEKAFSLMPILADALIDAGCDCDILLQHCQQPGTHVRGCWALDLLLGLE